MKRIALFLLTNLAVLVTLSVVAHLSGLSQLIGAQGLDFGGLLAFAALFGFGGAFVSLAISKWSAKMAVGARVIEHPTTPVAAFGISGGGKSGWAKFFSTHPALEDRIAALRASGSERRVAHQPTAS